MKQKINEKSDWDSHEDDYDDETEPLSAVQERSLEDRKLRNWAVEASGEVGHAIDDLIKKLDEAQANYEGLLELIRYKQKLTPGGAALAIYAVNNKDEHGKNAAEIARLLRVKPSAIGQYKDMTQTDIKSRLRLLGGK
jgi:hypothetical protein